MSNTRILDKLKKEKDFLFLKLRDIDNLTDIFKEKDISTQELVVKIKMIIHMKKDRKVNNDG